MKNKKLLIISLTIVIIILIMQLILNKNRIINISDKMIKGMSSSVQETELNNQINSLNVEHTDYMNYIQSCKAKLANALTNEGVTTSNEATLETMAESISKVLQARTSDATATADNITKGCTAYVNGQLITGTGADNNLFYNLGMSDSTSNLTLSFSYTNKEEGNKSYTTPSDCDFLIAIVSYATAGIKDSSNLSISGLPNMVEISKSMNYYIDNTTNGFLIVYAYNVPSQTVIEFATDRNMRLAGCYGLAITK